MNRRRWRFVLGFLLGHSQTGWSVIGGIGGICPAVENIIMEHKSFATSSAGIFDAADNVRIGRAKFTNVASNAMVNSFFPSTFVQESSAEMFS